MTLLSRRRALMSQNKEKYVFVEYIESTGTQWIDTGFKPNPKTTIIMDYQLTAIEPSKYVYGSRGDGTSNYQSMYYLHINGDSKYALGYGALLGNVFASKPTPDTNRHVMHRNKGTVYIDNAYAHGFNANVTFECVNNLEIFASYSNREGVNPVKMRLYSFKICEGGLNGSGGTLLMDFVPCYRKTDKVAGLYDTASGTFFENQGTGNFLIGGEI